MTEFLLSNLPKVVNSLGLFLDISGAILIWFFGLPESINKEGKIHLTFGTDTNEEKKAKSYNFKSKIGLALLICGSVIQLVSNFIPNIN